MTRASPGYRADVDGLRAWSVTAVILYHLGYASFGGGFVGVDVFFVISGFLITQRILRDVDAGRFSFAEFYAARARRLFPALFVTLAGSLAAGVILFSPLHLERLAESLVYAVAFCANFLFWSEASYFDLRAELKPLLHTWSLSVEEQFYLLWPAILVGLLVRRRRLHLTIFLAAAAAASVWLSQYWIARDPEAAFYLLPARVFELAIGALCVGLVKHRPRNALWLEPIAALGLAAIVYAAMFFDAETPFPGLYALVPCLGAAAVIYAGTARYAGRLLDNRVAVGIGLVSYSLYLVHWPIIVFYKYWRSGELGEPERLAIIAVSLAAAALMYRFVERPFRVPPRTPGRLGPLAYGTACLALAFPLGAAAAAVWRSDGWSARVPEEIRPAVTEAKKLRNNQLVHQRRKEPFPKAGVANGVILGDSHATDLFNALEQNNPALFLTTLSVSVNCQPTVGPWPYERKEKVQRCRRRIERVLRSPQLKAADYVIFSARWTGWAVDSLPATLKAIRKVSAARIIVFGPTVEFRPDVPVLVFKHGRLDGVEDFVNRHKVEERLRLSERLARLAREHDFAYVDKIAVLCPQQRCPVLVPGSGALMYTDYGHWSLDGAAYFGRLLRERVPAAGALFAAGR